MLLFLCMFNCVRVLMYLIRVLCSSVRSSHLELFCKMVLLKVSQIRTKTPLPESLFNKFAGFKNTCFYGTPPVAASVVFLNVHSLPSH